MKIITMCRGGNVRSVAAKQILNRLGHEVIAIGADNTNFSTKKFLFDWADIIVVMSPNFFDFIPTEYFDDGKVEIIDVGNDVWGTPFSEKLQTKIVNIVKNNKILMGTRDLNLDDVIGAIRAYKAKLLERNLQDGAI